METAGIEPAAAALAGRARSLAVIPMRSWPPRKLRPGPSAVRPRLAALTFPAVELSKGKPVKGFAGTEGIEPSFADFGDRCSAKLSYIPKALKTCQ